MMLPAEIAPAIAKRLVEVEALRAASLEVRVAIFYATLINIIAVVPVMLQRILELDDEILDRYDLSHVKAVPVSGSALPGSPSPARCASRWPVRFSGSSSWSASWPPT